MAVAERWVQLYGIRGVKSLQTVLIIFRVSFNVKQKMPEIGRGGALSTRPFDQAMGEG